MERSVAEGLRDMGEAGETAGTYDVEHRARHAIRPGFRISELQISPTQEVPWHYHTNIQDTFYVLSGTIQILLANPTEDVRLMAGQTYSVPPRRPHLVKNAGDISAVIFILQGIGEYDFCLATEGSHAK